MKTKHTPGPWKSSLAVVANAPSTYAYVVTNGKWGAPNVALAYDEANARLIAAAPELLEALKVAWDLLEENCLGQGHAQKLVYDAILKAEGGQ